MKKFKKFEKTSKLNFTVTCVLIYIFVYKLKFIKLGTFIAINSLKFFSLLKAQIRSGGEFTPKRFGRYSKHIFCSRIGCLSHRRQTMRSCRQRSKIGWRTNEAMLSDSGRKFTYQINAFGGRWKTMKRDEKVQFGV